MDRRLGRPLPHQLPNPTRANPLAINLSPEGHIRYYSQFPEAIPYQRAYSHALLTRPPLDPKVSLDLHVLGLPPAFVLSQDQTLKLKHPKMFLTERPCTSSNPRKDQMLLLVVSHFREIRQTVKLTPGSSGCPYQVDIQALPVVIDQTARISLQVYVTMSNSRETNKPQPRQTLSAPSKPCFQISSLRSRSRWPI